MSLIRRLKSPREPKLETPQVFSFRKQSSTRRAPAARPVDAIHGCMAFVVASWAAIRHAVALGSTARGAGTHSWPRVRTSPSLPVLCTKQLWFTERQCDRRALCRCSDRARPAEMAALLCDHLRTAAQCAWRLPAHFSEPSRPGCLVTSAAPAMFAADHADDRAPPAGARVVGGGGTTP
jgi:hypothetical protein